MSSRPEFPRSEPVTAVASRFVATARPGRTDEFWRRVAEVGTPVVEPDPSGHPDHRAVTFLWRDRPVAGLPVRTVVLHANKFTDYDDLAATSLARLPGTDVWHATFRLRADWRCSYQLGPLTDLPALSGRHHRDELMRHAEPDPFNRTPLRGRHTGRTFSVAGLDAAPARFWVDAPAEPPRELPGTRPVWVHGPADGGPVLVLLDGDVWAREHPIAPTLDALTAAGRLPALTTVMVGPSAAGRTADLTCDPAYPGHLVALLDELGLRPDPARTIVAGQSLGGLAATHAALSRADRFGTVIAQSGSFWWPGDTSGTTWLSHCREASHCPEATRALRVVLQVGTQEWGMPQIVGRVRDALADKGHSVSTVEYYGGHDQAWWQVGLITALLDLTAEW
ncbi:enterochelin esterase [Actinosynnema sp. NPDC047251]|uniref:enterochelin esterase n=1 Tax=Saccharothrix espanaensis TaxID=103731 RepID=UPI0002E426F7|nr:enterochelin esterase [Saccharothrix espanaensis]